MNTFSYLYGMKKRTEIEILEQRLSAAKATNATLRARHAELCTQQAQLTSQIDYLQHVIKDLNTTKSALEAMLEQRNTDIDKAQSWESAHHHGLSKSRDF